MDFWRISSVRMAMTSPSHRWTIELCIANFIRSARPLAGRQYSTLIRHVRAAALSDTSPT